MSNARAVTRPANGHGPAGGTGRATRWPDLGTRRARLRLPVISAAIFCFAWAAGAFAYVWHWENALAQSSLTSAARNQFLAVHYGLDDYLAKLTALRALFESSNDVTREQFGQFTERLLKNETAIQNFSWVPRVARAERSGLEQAAVRDGIAGYGIKGVTEDDRMVASPQQDEYLPIYYSSVRNAKSPIYGIDLRSQPAVRQRLERARDTDGLSVVPDFVLHSVKGQVHGFLFSLPVYRAGLPHQDVETRRQNLLGYVHGAFLTGEAFEHIINTVTTPIGLDLYLFPAGAGRHTSPLHVHHSRLGGHSSAPLSSGSSMAGRISSISSRPATSAGYSPQSHSPAGRSPCGTTAPGWCSPPACWSARSRCSTSTRRAGKPAACSRRTRGSPTSRRPTR